ncbi:hypothetical protein [Brucella sp.]|uniref:hypothetical protein n=1 Tax=Brucella sp. TaxID=52132 RepID=UPI0028A9DE3C|nr:hypothetical protein [Brucella sp.]
MNQTTEDLGLTPSERYLGNLCRNSFLSLWSYPNPYTDRGIGESSRQGKELCDLLVVFGKHVIIFSDKSCEFPNTGDVNVDWRRWYKKAIDKSAQQIHGAEKWIRDFPDRVYLDKMCSQKFPFSLLDKGGLIFHRIVVATGASGRCESFFGLGSRGSLMLSPSLSDRDHYSDHELGGPFRIGRVNSQKGFVHVFDEVSLDIVMTELDTITDFVNYLSEKEKFLAQDKVLFCPGEEDLLGFYLNNMSQNGEPSFDLNGVEIEEGQKIFISEEQWDYYRSSEFRKMRLALAKDGLFIDRLIEHFTSYVREGTLAYGNEAGLTGNERNLRFLAAEPRIQRALMANAINQKITTTPRNVRTSIFMPSSNERTIFFFLLFPKEASWSRKRYRKERQAALTAYAHVIRFKSPNVDFVYGLATEPGTSSSARSEDLMSFDFTGWSEEEDEEAQILQKKLDILVDYSERSLLFDPPNTYRPDLAKGNRKERRRLKALKRGGRLN